MRRRIREKHLHNKHRMGQVARVGWESNINLLILPRSRSIRQISLPDIIYEFLSEPMAVIF
jgi:hypothetical protein